jgi:hypothetical protein
MSEGLEAKAFKPFKICFNCNADYYQRYKKKRIQEYCNDCKNFQDVVCVEVAQKEIELLRNFKDALVRNNEKHLKYEMVLEGVLAKARLIIDETRRWKLAFAFDSQRDGFLRWREKLLGVLDKNDLFSEKAQPKNDEMELCPKCGKLYPLTALTDSGQTYKFCKCGWIEPSVWDESKTEKKLKEI